MYFRFRTTGSGDDISTLPQTVVEAFSEAWKGAPVRMSVQAINETHYAFYAASSSAPLQTVVLGNAPVTIVSGGTGPFTGK